MKSHLQWRWTLVLGIEKTILRKMKPLLSVTNARARIRLLKDISPSVQNSPALRPENRLRRVRLADWMNRARHCVPPRRQLRPWNQRRKDIQLTRLFRESRTKSVRRRRR